MRYFGRVLAVLLSLVLCPAYSLWGVEHAEGAPVIYTFDEPGWQIIGPGEISNAYGVHSAPVALSLSGNGSSEFGSAAYYYNLEPMVEGREYTVCAWVNSDLSVEYTPLRVLLLFENGGPVFVATVRKSEVTGGGWKHLTLGTFVFSLDQSPGPPFTVPFVGIRLWNDPTDPVAIGRWLVDDIRIDQVLWNHEVRPPTVWIPEDSIECVPWSPETKPGGQWNAEDHGACGLWTPEVKPPSSWSGR